MAAEPRRPIAWRALGSIRARLTILAVAIVGVAAVLGSIALVASLDAALTATIREDVRLRAADLTATLETLVRPAELALGSSDDMLVQVLDPSGTVIAAGGETPMQPLAPGLQPGESTTVSVAGDDDAYLVVAADATVDGATYVVQVGRVLDLVAESTAAVAASLTIGIPLLLALVGAVAWVLVGRALAPVEAIRTEVARISETELERRVPIPRTGDEIARLAATMNDMLDRLERAIARQRQLVADTSHELRSPIAAIRQHAEVARAHPERTTLGELAATVLAEDLRLARLVDDLLLLARADEGSLRFADEPIDLDDLVLEAVARTHPRPGVTIEADDVGRARVRGDVAALRGLVDNLVENAARHARSRVRVGLERVGTTVRLRVEDDGTGIAPADRERVLERFVRLDTARDRDSGGSGLGLAIVAEVARVHGGSVEIDDSHLGGAQVEVRLPALD